MAKDKTGNNLTKDTWLKVRAPKSSMDPDYNLEFDYMDSPHEESWWDPGIVLDSRGNTDEGRGDAGPKKRQVGTQKNSGGDVVDV